MKIKAKCKCGEEVEIEVVEFKPNEVHHYYHPQYQPPTYNPIPGNVPLPQPPTWYQVIC